MVGHVQRLRWSCALAPARRRCYRDVRRRFRLVHTICRVGIGLLLAGNVSALLSDGVNEQWLRDVPSSINEHLQDLVDVAFGAAEYVNYTLRRGTLRVGTPRTNVSAVRNLPYEPALKVRVEQRVSGAATWRFARTYTSPHGGWGNSTVVKTSKVPCRSNTLKEEGRPGSHTTL